MRLFRPHLIAICAIVSVAACNCDEDQNNGTNNPVNKANNMADVDLDAANSNTGDAGNNNSPDGSAPDAMTNPDGSMPDMGGADAGPMCNANGTMCALGDEC